MSKFTLEGIYRSDDFLNASLRLRGYIFVRENILRGKVTNCAEGVSSSIEGHLHERGGLDSLVFLKYPVNEESFMSTIYSLNKESSGNLEGEYSGLWGVFPFKIEFNKEWGLFVEKIDMNLCEVGGSAKITLIGNDFN